MKTIRVFSFLSLTMATLVGIARADEASEATLQFDLGRELYGQRRLPEAIDRFVASNRLVPNANVVFNIVSTYVLLAKKALKNREIANADQHFVEAYNWVETYLQFTLPETEKQEGIRLRDSLKPRVALVDVTSTPLGAEIVIDRDALGSVGLSPRVVAMPPGPHTVILKAPGYRAGRAEVQTRKGEAVAARLDLERITGTLRVESTPPSARVRVVGSGEDLGATPLTRVVPVGMLRIIVSQKGYLDQTGEIVVGDRATMSLSVTLQRAAQTVATLSVTGAPSSAMVRLDGRPVGQVPTSVADLAPGRGHLEILAPSHKAWSGEIPLEAGGATRIAVRLAPEETPHWGGWKWIGYGGGGVLLAGGLVVGLVAKSARDDFFAAPSTAAYDRVGRLNVTTDVLLATGAATLLTAAVVHWLWPRPVASHAEVTVVR